MSPYATDCLNEKTILVTGAGSGIGRAIAKHIDACGGKPLLLGRHVESLKETLSELTQNPSENQIYVCDLQSEAERASTFEKITLHHPYLLGIVNNAGGQFLSPLEKISSNAWAKVMTLNFSAAAHLSQLFFNVYGKKNGGRLIHILADFEKGMPMMGHSGAARAALKNFTLTAAVEWGRYRVCSNAIAPGYISSSGLETYPLEAIEMMDKLPESVPLGRLGLVDEVAHSVIFLLSEAGSYINGVVLKVDGGSSLMFGPWPMPEVQK